MSRFAIFAYLISLLMGACQSASTRTWELPADVKAKIVNGYEMAYIERGEGIPIVMIHGSLNDYRAFRVQLEPLGAKYHAIAVSLRHYYPERWDGKGGHFSERQHVADLAEFIKQLNAGPVYVVGHSRGGVIASLLAAKHPEAVRALVLAEPVLSRMLDESDPAATRRQSQINKTLAILETGDIERGLEFFIDGAAGPGAWKARPELDRQMSRDNAWTLKGDQPDTQEHFKCHDARRIDAPVLLVGGERSPPIFARIMDALSPCLKRSERVVIPGASHPMNRMNPSFFDKIVLDFFARNRF